MVAEDIGLVPLGLDERGVELCLLRLARLADPAAAAARFLTLREREEFERLRHPGRRSEWLGARVCLKAMLVNRGCLSDPLQCEIVKDGRGRPRLSFSPGFPRAAVVDCSLSHKASFACACASSIAKTRVGVDIERASSASRLAKLAPAFVSDRDSVISASHPEARLAVLWALKEACSKAVGVGMGLALADVICEETAEGRHTLTLERGPRFCAQHFVHEDYVIALCLMREEACPAVA